jgi:hypothetical protein
MCFRLQTCSSRQEVSDTCDYCHTRVYETEEVWACKLRSYCKRARSLTGAKGTRQSVSNTLLPASTTGL